VHYNIYPQWVVPISAEHSKIGLFGNLKNKRPFGPLELKALPKPSTRYSWTSRVRARERKKRGAEGQGKTELR